MNVVAIVIAAAAVIALLVAGKELLIPLVLAIFFWILIRILKATFERITLAGRRLPELAAFVLALATIVSASTAVARIVSNNISKIVAEAPGYEKLLGQTIAETFGAFGIAEAPTVRQLISSLDLFQLLTTSATAVAALAGQAGLVAVYVLFLFLEERFFARKLQLLFPDPGQRQRIKATLTHLVDDIRTYVGIKSLASLVVAVPCYLLMAAFGLDFASFWGLLVFILNFIPYVGSAVATLVPSVLALLQFGDPVRALLLAAGIGACQFTVAYIVEPRLIGRSLNLSPLVVILSLVLWWALWGVPGMFLCVPIMVSLMILCAQFPQTRRLAILMSRTGRVAELSNRTEADTQRIAISRSTGAAAARTAAAASKLD